LLQFLIFVEEQVSQQARNYYLYRRENYATKRSYYQNIAFDDIGMDGNF